MGEAPDAREREDCPDPTACDSSCDQHTRPAGGDTSRPANPLLADALRYYAERRSMSNPKGWGHVERKVEQAIEGGLWPNVTAEQIEEARTTLRVLAADDAAVAAHLDESVRAAKLSALTDARRVITQYLSTAAPWRYDRVCWAFAIMLGEIPEDSPEPMSSSDEAEIRRRSRLAVERAGS